MSSLQIRIYFEDTDAQGLVYNSNYLKFLERGRTEFLRNLGYDQKKLLKEGLIFVVKKVNLDFVKPAELDEIIEVKSKIESVKKVSFTFVQEIFDSNQKKILDANVKCGCLEIKNMKPFKIPNGLYQLMKVNIDGI